MRRAIIAGTALVGIGTAALAQEAAVGDAPVVGRPYNWKVGLQESFSPVQEQMHWFSDYTLAFIIPITALVGALLAWCIWRYREARNPNPSRMSHHTTIEVIWTVAPVLILLIIAIPSFQILTLQYNPPREPELTVKATGFQWYWGYEYQTGGEAGDEGAASALSFVSYPLNEADRESYGKLDPHYYPQQLMVDNELVVPVDTVVRILSTSADVIHSFGIPSLGVKVDAVPGRLNEYWFEANREGIFYGQCYELCGQNHFFMPIAIRAVSREQYDLWYAAAQDDVEAANQELMAAIEAERNGTDLASR